MAAHERNLSIQTDKVQASLVADVGGKRWVANHRRDWERSSDPIDGRIGSQPSKTPPFGPWREARSCAEPSCSMAWSVIAYPIVALHRPMAYHLHGRGARDTRALEVPDGCAWEQTSAGG